MLLAEITFWACLLLGFAFRYFFKLPRAGIALLIATPVIDLVLLGFTYYTLSQENQASFMHGFAAFYISFSVVFGRDVIAAVDRKLNGSTEISVGTSSADGLKKCVVASAITPVLLAIGIAITGWHIGEFLVDVLVDCGAVYAAGMVGHRHVSATSRAEEVRLIAAAS